MRIPIFLAYAATLAMAAVSVAQTPSAKTKAGRSASGANAGAAIGRLLLLDKNNDGEFSKSEVTEPGLQALFNRADADGDGTVTKEELTTLVNKGPSAFTEGSRTGTVRGLSGMRKPSVVHGASGLGSTAMGPPPSVGEILPLAAQEQLQLTSDQQKKVDALQKEVDAKLKRILSADQRKKFDELRVHGPPGEPEIRWAGPKRGAPKPTVEEE